VLGEPCDQIERLRLQHAGGDRHAGRLQKTQAGAIDERIRVSNGGHDVHDARVAHGRRARRGPAHVAARFKGDVKRGPPSAFTRSPECVDLGVRGPGAFVPPFPHDLPAGHHHRTDHRVGCGQPETVRGELEGPLHESFVILHASPNLSRDETSWRGERHARPARGRREIVPVLSHPDCTVGPGVSPGPPPTGGRRVADCHRRWGISPRPEDELFYWRKV
jgi:hypothetical protein